MGLQVAQIGVLAARVDYKEQRAKARSGRRSVGAHHHQVVEQAAARIGEEGVALASRREVDQVHRHQGLEGGCSVVADQPDLTHVRDIEQHRRRAALPVFGHQAVLALHRHRVAGKGHHARAQADMKSVQWGLEQGSV